MAYRVIIKRSAEKELDTLQKDIQRRIIARLLALEGNPRPHGIKRLQGENAYRLRTGEYRVLYTIDDEEKIVTIFTIGHCREVYR